MTAVSPTRNVHPIPFCISVTTVGARRGTIERRDVPMEDGPRYGRFPVWWNPIHERPFQGRFNFFHNMPRALPWADRTKPFRFEDLPEVGIHCLRPAFDS